MSMTKSLVRHEIRKVKYSSLAFILLVVVQLIMLFLHLNRASEYRYDEYSTFYPKNGSEFVSNLRSTLIGVTIPACLIIIMTVFIQFYEWRQTQVSQFLSSLPVRKSQVVRVKYLIGCTVITIPCALLAIVGLWVRAIFINEIRIASIVSSYYDLIIANDSVVNVLLHIFVFWISMISVYSVLFCLQIVIHNGMLASFFGVLLLTLPGFIVFCVNHLMTRFMSQTMEGYSRIYSYAMPWFYNTYGGEPYVEDAAVESQVHFVVFDHVTSKIFIMVAITFLAVGIAFRLFRNHDISRNDKIISYPSVRILVLTVTAIYVGLVISLVPRGEQIGFVPLLIAMVFAGVTAVALLQYAIMISDKE